MSLRTCLFNKLLWNCRKLRKVVRLIKNWLLLLIAACTLHECDVERCISANNLIKTKIRPLISLETENNYLYIHTNMPDLLPLEVAAAKLFVEEKARRQNITTAMKWPNDKNKEFSQRQRIVRNSTMSVMLKISLPRILLIFKSLFFYWFFMNVIK